MNKINNQKLFRFHKNNLKKKRIAKTYSYFIFLLIYIFFILLIETYEQLEISLVVKKTELKYISDEFYKKPSNVQQLSIEGYDGIYSPLDYVYVTITFDSFIESCENMFKELTNIVEINLKNLDTSKVTSMNSMLYGCSNLKSLYFGNINTSLVKNMEKLFYQCTKLESIDVSNFDTSSVTSMAAMFDHCEILTSINVSNFNTKNVENMHDMFGNCYNITSINVLNFDTSNLKILQGMFNRNHGLKDLDLSNFNINSVTNMKYMFLENKSLLYLNIYSFVIKSGTELDEILLDTPSNLKICINDLNTRNLLSSYGKNFDCSDVCINKNLKIDSQYKRCVENCSESNYKYEYNNTCYNECPYETYSKENEYFCYDEKPEGYFLDLNDLKYKKCFDRCKNCYGSGNEINNNCSECKSNYIISNGSYYNFLYELNINGYKNCYIKCPYYFYFNKNYSLHYCTKEEKCPEEYDKLIKERNECVNKCEEDNKYKYEYKKRCYEQCPEGSMKIINNIVINEYFCKPICTEENPFEYIYTQECVKNCPIKDMKQNTCIQNYKNDKKDEELGSDNKNKEENNKEDTKAQDIMLQNIETGFTSEDYDTSNLENGEDDVFEDEKMTVTLTTTQNQKDNSNNNMTIIDLGECEYLLRKEYNIPDNDLLYMKKIDVIQEGMKIPKVEYDVYSKLNGSRLVKLNLTICQNSKVSLSVPITISESLDKLNSSSGYYNDICYAATSDGGTDISLKDRKKEFVENNKSVCQEDCDFSEYDYNTQKAKCSCKVKESSSTSLADMKINKTKLYENFVDIKNIANIKLMVCYKELLSIKGIKNNIAFYVTVPIIIFHIIVIILFYIKQKNKIDNKIKDIAFSINNWYLVKADERKKREIERKRLEKIIKNKLIHKKNKQINKYKEINNISNEKEDKKVEIIKILNPIDYYYLNEILNKQKNPPKKKKEKIKLRINNYNYIINNKNDKSSKRSIINKNNKEQEIIKKSKEVMEYNDEEKNNLKYELALKYDKRTYIEYYISLLKTKHLFIFSFFNNEDYNSRIIKIGLFFISFIIYYSVNALFFNDNTMHKIYEDEGSFNFIYQLPQIAYSSLISAVLNILLKLLALPQATILVYKKNKNKNDLDKRTKELNDKLNIKFILYFIISFIFLLFFWYYLSMFCAIYRNTQYHLIKDTLISFGLSLIYPFGIYLLPGIFRLPALSNPKNKRKFLYNFSLIFQML